jgi:hypothetical protein
MKPRASLTVGYMCVIVGLFLASFGLGLAAFTHWSIIPALVGVFTACWGFDVLDAHSKRLQ